MLVPRIAMNMATRSLFNRCEAPERRSPALRLFTENSKKPTSNIDPDEPISMAVDDFLQFSSPLNVNAKNIISSLNGPLNPGYMSDDEASDTEPCDSGRSTRSSTRRANQANQQDKNSDKQPNPADNNDNSNSFDGSRNRKRKRNSQGDGEDSDDGNSRGRPRVDTTSITNDQLAPAVCSCPKDVMKCIGILPSLPIINNFRDSDDSESSLEDMTHTVLPMVSRSRRDGGGGRGGGGGEEC